MGRLSVDSVNLDEAYEIEKRRNSRMHEIANAHNASVHESAAPFSKEWLARNSTDIRMEIKGKMLRMRYATFLLDPSLCSMRWTNGLQPR